MRRESQEKKPPQKLGRTSRGFKTSRVLSGKIYTARVLTCDDCVDAAKSLPDLKPTRRSKQSPILCLFRISVQPLNKGVCFTWSVQKRKRLMRVAVCGNADCVRLLCRRSAAWQLHPFEALIHATIYILHRMILSQIP